VPNVTVFESVTLDGVMQAPGRPDEDTRGGFQDGGVGHAVRRPGPRPDGRGGDGHHGGHPAGATDVRGLLRVLAQPADNPFTTALDNTQKFVASRTLQEPLPWRNSTLLQGDAVDAVAGLRKEPGGDLVILGSGELFRSLMRRGLVDRYVLLIHPLVLGSGRRLFADDGRVAALRLVDTTTTTTGVVVATYEAAERSR
jgi:dihydrofolate reductase